MGVRGLSTYLEKQGDAIATQLDLAAEAAKAPGGLGLIIDLNNVAYNLVAEAEVKAARDAKASPTAAVILNIAGGEYDLIEQHVIEYFGRLCAAGIKPLCFLDPAQGTDEDERQKFDTWARRHMDDRMRALEVQKWCATGRGLATAAGGGRNGGNGARHFTLPPLAMRQVVRALQRMQIHVRMCVGEADLQLVHEMQRHSAFAVVSDDSDFAVIRGSRWIPARSLAVGEAGVRAALVTPAAVAKALNLSEAALAELAALVGNDITGAAVESLGVLRAVGVFAPYGRPQVEDVARWIRQMPARSASTSPALRDLLAAHGELREAWQKSSLFYAGRLPAAPPLPPPERDRWSALEEGMAALILPGYSLAVARHGRYWCSPAVECCACADGASPLCHELLAPLRQVAYRLLDRRAVEERSAPAGAWALAPRLAPAAAPGALPPAVEAALAAVPSAWHALLECHRGGPARARALAALCHTHLLALPGAPAALPELPAGPLAAPALLLRFFLSLVPARGMDLTPREWSALLLTVAACASPAGGPILERARRQLLANAAAALSAAPGARRPSFRSLQVAARWQACAAACSALGQLLCEPAFFGEPRSLWSGAAFQAFLADPLAPGIPDDVLRGAAALRAAVAAGFPPGAGEHGSPLRVFLVESAAAVWIQDESPSSVYAAAQHGACWEAVEALWDEEGDSDEDVEAMLEEAARAGRPEGGGDALLEPPPELAPPGPPPAAGDRLPIDGHREEIVEYIRTHRVTCIQGETGSGKSSRVPLFLLQDARALGEPVNMVMTQPRRIAAMSLAKRVADTLGEEVGGTVGFCVSRNRKTSSRTRLTYVTVGYLLQLLSHKPEEASRYTHVLLDEIHERNVDADLLSLLLKVLLRGHPSVKLVIMSATLQADLFSRYFAELSPDGAAPPPIFVGAARFPLEFLYLDTLAARFPNLAEPARRAASHFPRSGARALPSDGDARRAGFSGRAAREAGRLPKAEIKRETYGLATALLGRILLPGQTVLAFLPGVAEIASLQTSVQEGLPGASDPARLHLVILHSMVSKEEQEAAFAPLAPGVARLILATNIAESSITLPAVHYVLDFGLHRHLVLDKARGIQCLTLTWCSRASCKQRAGRAGRLFPGTVVRFMPKEFHDTALADFDEAEMLRVSLEHAVLRVKLLFARFGTVAELLRQSVESPSAEEVAYALDELHRAGALTGAGEASEVTLFGHLAAVMPVDLHVSKLVLYGLLLHRECDALCMAAAMSVQDPFSLPMMQYTPDIRAYCADLEKNFRARMHYDAGEYSELIAYRNLWIAWTRSQRSREWAHRASVSFERMKAFDATVADLATHFIGFLSRNGVDVERLPGLQAMSQRWRDDPDGGGWTRDAFVPDTRPLKALLALASRPGLFLRATLPEGKKVDRPLRSMRELGLDPARTLVVGVSVNRPGELGSGRLARLLGDLVGVDAERVEAAGRDSPGSYFLQLRAPDRPPGATQRQAGLLGAPPRLLQRGRDSPVGGGRPASPGAPAPPQGELLRDLPPDGKLLRQLTAGLAFGAKFVVPLEAPAPGPPGSASPDEPAATIANIGQPLTLNWKVLHPVAQARPYWRSPLFAACEFRPGLDIWAVAAQAQATESGSSVRVAGVSVLPPEGRFAELLLLAAAASEADRGAPLRLYVDSSFSRIHSFALPRSSAVVPFAPFMPPLHATVAAVNRVRACLSACYSAGAWPKAGEAKEALDALLACAPSAPFDEERGKGPSKRKQRLASYKWVLLPLAPPEAAGEGGGYAFLPPYVGPIEEQDMPRFLAGEDPAALLAAASRAGRAGPALPSPAGGPGVGDWDYEGEAGPAEAYGAAEAGGGAPVEASRLDKKTAKMLRDVAQRCAGAGLPAPSLVQAGPAAARLVCGGAVLAEARGKTLQKALRDAINGGMAQARAPPPPELGLDGRGAALYAELVLECRGRGLGEPSFRIVEGGHGACRVLVAFAGARPVEGNGGKGGPAAAAKGPLAPPPGRQAALPATPAGLDKKGAEIFRRIAAACDFHGLGAPRVEGAGGGGWRVLVKEAGVDSRAPHPNGALADAAQRLQNWARARGLPEAPGAAPQGFPPTASSSFGGGGPSAPPPIPRLVSGGGGGGGGKAGGASPASVEEALGPREREELEQLASDASWAGLERPVLSLAPSPGDGSVRVVAKLPGLGALPPGPPLPEAYFGRGPTSAPPPATPSAAPPTHCAAPRASTPRPRPRLLRPAFSAPAPAPKAKPQQAKQQQQQGKPAAASGAAAGGQQLSKKAENVLRNLVEKCQRLRVAPPALSYLPDGSVSVEVPQLGVAARGAGKHAAEDALLDAWAVVQTLRSAGGGGGAQKPQAAKAEAAAAAASGGRAAGAPGRGLMPLAQAAPPAPGAPSTGSGGGSRGRGRRGGGGSGKGPAAAGGGGADAAFDD
eukprot:tig00021127_g18752.t1